MKAFREPPALLELPDPSPSDGEIRVRLEAAGVNPFDWKIADGILKDHRPHVFPLILGVDGAGTVGAAGSKVRRFRVGDRVFGQFLHDPIGRGTYAEQVAVPETNALVRIPPALSSLEAAALPTAGMTALDSLDKIGLSPGMSLLVVGASGGVGSFVVPLAVAAGIRVVAIARSSSHARLRSLGAIETVDAAGGDPVGELRARHPAGLDGLLDVVSDAATFARWAGLVRPGGAVASTVYAAGTTPGVRSINVDLTPSAPLLDRLTGAVAAGKVRPPIERTISLADAPSAVADGRAGRLAGKTVIRIDARGAPPTAP